MLPQILQGERRPDPQQGVAMGDGGAVDADVAERASTDHRFPLAGERLAKVKVLAEDDEMKTRDALLASQYGSGGRSD